MKGGEELGDKVVNAGFTEDAAGQQGGTPENVVCWGLTRPLSQRIGSLLTLSLDENFHLPGLDPLPVHWEFIVLDDSAQLPQNQLQNRPSGHPVTGKRGKGSPGPQAETLRGARKTFGIARLKNKKKQQQTSCCLLKRKFSGTFILSGPSTGSSLPQELATSLLGESVPVHSWHQPHPVCH